MSSLHDSKDMKEKYELPHPPIYYNYNARKDNNLIYDLDAFETNVSLPELHGFPKRPFKYLQIQKLIY